MQFLEVAAFSPLWATFFVVAAFVFGACFGSFMNCLAWRIVAHESVLTGRSHCARCDHALGLLDLIPLVSWVALRGTCRYCGEKIAARYPITELICGGFFASMIVVYGLTWHALALCALGCILLGLSLVDLETLTIPNGFIIAGILVWIASVACYGIDFNGVGLGALFAMVAPSPLIAVVLDGLLGAFVVAGFLFVAALAFDKLTGKRSLGGGDVKLVFMVGLFLGLAGSAFNLILSCLVGLAFAMATQRATSQGSGKPFPFGPSIACATWATLIVGPRLIELYFGLF